MPNFGGVFVFSTSDFKKGLRILYKNEPYVVLDFQHVKPGKGGAFVRTKMRNLITGFVREETFRSGEKFYDPSVQRKKMQYLYKDDAIYFFMDQETFEQVGLNENQLEDILSFLKEETVYEILYFMGKPISVTAPLFMELKIVEAQPGVRGDTAKGGATKPATLETGLVVQVPLFVNEGDTVRVDTRTSEYMERVDSK